MVRKVQLKNPGGVKSETKKLEWHVKSKQLKNSSSTRNSTENIIKSCSAECLFIVLKGYPSVEFCKTILYLLSLRLKYFKIV